MEYYHFTSFNNLPSIGEKGLVPNIGDRSKSTGDRRKAVFFSEGFEGTIRMYSAIKDHFNKSTGENGQELIKWHQKEIESDEKYIADGYLWDLDEVLQDIEARKAEIENIKYIMKFKSFEEYLGDCCYLYVNGLFSKPERYNPGDRPVKRIISPSRIFVVGLCKSGFNQEDYSMEKVLSHFMSFKPCEILVNNLHNLVEIRNLEKFYNERMQEIEKYSYKNGFHLTYKRLEQYLLENMGVVRERKEIK